jgi:hypothetical protein
VFVTAFERPLRCNCPPINCSRNETVVLEMTGSHEQAANIKKETQKNKSMRTATAPSLWLKYYSYCIF